MTTPYNTFKEREIKFRAWNKEENKIKYSSEYPDLPCFFTLNQWQLGQEMYPMMQYTGLKDKNGKEIYEGDIVRRLTEKYQVIFGEGYIEPFYTYGITGDTYEIIGNIYENPDLITNIEKG